MALCVPTDHGGTCAICFEDFEAGEEQITHEGGERHDGFHRKCILTWTAQSPTCPVDRMEINPDSLLTRTEMIMRRLRPALANAAYAACFGAAAGAVTAGITSMGGGYVVNGAYFLYTAEIAARTAEEERPVLELLGSAGALGALIGAGTEKVVGIASGAMLGAAAGVVGGAIGAGICRILNRRGFNLIDRENIAVGICMGALTTFASRAVIHFLPAVAINFMVGGVAAGIVSLLRR